MSARRTPSGRFESRFTIDGVPYSHVFDTKADADDWELVTRARHVTGPMPSSITVGQYATRWLDGYLDGLRSTWKGHEGNVRIHIVPVLGGFPLRSVTPTDVKRMLSRVADRVSVRKAENVYRTTSALFHAAEQDDLIGRVPVKARKHRPKIQIEPKEVLSRGAAREVLMMLGGWQRDTAVVQLSLGARVGEVCGLTPHDVADGHVTIRRRYTYGLHTVAATKTHRLRTLQIPRGAAKSTIDRLMAERYDSPPIPDLGDREHDGRQWDGYWLIQTSTGRPANLNTYNRQLGDACETLGLPRLSSHGLRHTFVSWMIDDGHTADQIGFWIGDTAETVRRVYSHMLEGGSAPAAESIERALGDLG